MTKWLCLALLAGCLDEHELGSTGSFPAPGVDQAPIATPGTWAITLGGDGDDDARGIVRDHNNNVIVGGTFQSTVDFGDRVATSGTFSGFITKRSGNDGSAIWTRTIGLDSTTSITDIAVLPNDSVVVLAAIQGDVDFGDGHIVHGTTATSVVARYDANGVLVGLASLDGELTRMAVAHDGTVALATTADGAKAVTLLDGTGALEWTTTIDVVSLSGLAITPNDDVVFAGDFRADFSLAGTTITAPTPGDTTAFIAQVSSAGQVEWSQVVAFPTPVDASAAGPVAVDADGRVIAAYGQHDPGDPTPSERLRLDTRDLHGALLWSTVAPSSGALVSGVGARTDGTIITTGGITTSFPVDFGNGPSPGVMFLASYDASGRFVSSRLFGGLNRDCLGSFDQIALGSDTVIAGAGLMSMPVDDSATIDLGTGPLPYHGGASDALIAMFVGSL